MGRRAVKDSKTKNITRAKLENTPFRNVGDMEAKSEKIHLQVWERLEYARLFQSMIDNDQYKFVKDELGEGLKCFFGSDQEELVRVFSKGKGVQISINQKLVAEVDKSEKFVEALIRSTSDSFSKSYYQIKGMLPAESISPALLEAASKSKK